MEAYVAHLPASSERIHQYRLAQANDPICSSVIACCQKGWPKKSLDAQLAPYWKARGELTVDNNGLLLYNKRIVVPKSLQRQTLQKIHTGHQGVQRCRLRANISAWWPGIAREVENMVKQCPVCTRTFTPRKQPMIPTDLPDYPWQKIATDLFQLKGRDYLLVVDYFSRFPEIQRLSSTTSSSVIGALKTMFSRFGIPETVISDNGSAVPLV